MHPPKKTKEEEGEREGGGGGSRTVLAGGRPPERRHVPTDHTEWMRGWCGACGRPKTRRQSRGHSVAAGEVWTRDTDSPRGGRLPHRDPPRAALLHSPSRQVPAAPGWGAQTRTATRRTGSWGCGGLSALILPSGAVPTVLLSLGGGRQPPGSTHGTQPHRLHRWRQPKKSLARPRVLWRHHEQQSGRRC